MSHADDIFYRQFGTVLILLAIFGFCSYFIAVTVGEVSYAKVTATPQATLERIASVGTVEVALAKEESQPAEGMAATENAEAQKPAIAAAEQPAKETVKAEPAMATNGEAVYESSCKVCHAAGLLNAPKPDDTQAWSDRAKAVGMDGLYHSAINGKPPNMAAKGGNMALTDEEVKAAVRFMLKQAGVDAG